MAGPPPFKTVNCEESFVLASLQEFVKVWSSGHQANFNLNCENGRAWLSLGFQLGSPSSPHHRNFGHPRPHGSVPPPYHRPRHKGLERRERDRARAARHQEARAQAAASTKSADSVEQVAETNFSSDAAAPAPSCPPSSTPSVASTGHTGPAQAATACTPGAPSPAAPAGPRPPQHAAPAGPRPTTHAASAGPLLPTHAAPAGPRHPPAAPFPLHAQAAPPSLSPIPQLDGSTDRDFPKKCKVCRNLWKQEMMLVGTLKTSMDVRTAES